MSRWALAILLPWRSAVCHLLHVSRMSYVHFAPDRCNAGPVIEVPIFNDVFLNYMSSLVDGIFRIGSTKVGQEPVALVSPPSGAKELSSHSMAI